MPYSILSVSWKWWKVAIANMISKVVHLFGNLNLKYKISCFKWKENINLLMNGHGETKISHRVIFRELIIKSVYKDLINFLSLTKVKIFIMCLIHGCSNIKIWYYRMIVEISWLKNLLNLGNTKVPNRWYCTWWWG